MAHFEVFVSKDTFKFNAAHFVAFKGYRERLHGHNYRVGVRLFGQRTISSDGYLIDFGDVKTVTKRVCKEINEHFLCPLHSDVLKIIVGGESNDQVRIECEDGSHFVIPAADCAMLPIVHATAEELAIYVYSQILSGLDACYLTEKRGIHTMEVTIAEAPGQEAAFRLPIPTGDAAHLDVRDFIATGNLTPTPCPTMKPPPPPVVKKQQCCSTCEDKLLRQLEALAIALNQRKAPLASGEEEVTVVTLQNLLDQSAHTS